MTGAGWAVRPTSQWIAPVGCAAHSAVVINKCFRMTARKATAAELSQKIWAALELEFGSRHVRSATALHLSERERSGVHCSTSAVVALVPPNRATRRLGTGDPRTASQFSVDQPLHLAVVAKTNAAQLCFRLSRCAPSATQPPPRRNHYDASDRDCGDVIHASPHAPCRGIGIYQNRLSTRSAISSTIGEKSSDGREHYGAAPGRAR